MKRVRKLVACLLCSAMIFSGVNTSAHSGRTDASGGHHDYKNASGLGSYHYHCGGHPAHLHRNGVCPYSASAKKVTGSTKKVSKYYQTATVKKVQKKLKKLGYSCGKVDGSYGKKTKKAIRKFQKKHGMTVNGKINRKLIKKLKINL